jgi:hypothetical protein
MLIVLLDTSLKVNQIQIKDFNNQPVAYVGNLKSCNLKIKIDCCISKQNKLLDVVFLSD